MRILFLTQIVPYPPDSGPKVKTWHVLRYLVGAGHRVTLVTFTRPEERPHLARLEQICAEVYPVPIRRSRLKDVGYLIRSNLTGRPFLIERDDLPEMRRLVARLLAEQKFEVIHADQFSMGQFLFPGKSLDGQNYPAAPLRVFDAHNAVWTIVARSRLTAPWILKPVLALEARRIKAYEGQLVQYSDRTLAVSEIDKNALLQAVNGLAHNGHDHLTETASTIFTIPIAVDTQQTKPLQLTPGSGQIVTLGTLHYPPNADGIRWFLKEVFPLVQQKNPAARLTIIGKNPPADFQQIAAAQPQAITLAGYVRELAPYLSQAALMVVPVRAGGGMRVRILEALAFGMPVVTTTVGLEGIAARPGVEVLVADTPQDFAQAVLDLMANPILQQTLAHNARLLAEQKYDWQSVLRSMDQVYQPFTEPQS
jgi:glycosyltransferase involved in cell wall biosynthesis